MLGASGSSSSAHTQTDVVEIESARCTTVSTNKQEKQIKQETMCLHMNYSVPYSCKRSVTPHSSLYIIVRLSRARQQYRPWRQPHTAHTHKQRERESIQRASREACEQLVLNCVDSEVAAVLIGNTLTQQQY
jgi:hypothetical protein